jgi:S-adenosylmethionine synthetase
MLFVTFLMRVCFDAILNLIDANTEYLINPTGRFVIGGGRFVLAGRQAQSQKNRTKA